MLERVRWPRAFQTRAYFFIMLVFEDPSSGFGHLYDLQHSTATGGFNRCVVPKYVGVQVTQAMTFICTFRLLLQGNKPRARSRVEQRATRQCAVRYMLALKAVARTVDWIFASTHMCIYIGTMLQNPQPSGCPWGYPQPNSVQSWAAPRLCRNEVLYNTAEHIVVRLSSGLSSTELHPELGFCRAM